MSDQPRSVLVRLDSITIPRGRRPIDPAKVKEIMDSVQQIGHLINPVTLRKQGRKLIAGRHRYEVYRKLGRARIPAIILDLDDMRAELAEIDENIIRNEPTALQRGEMLSRRKEIYEELHPETKQGGDRKSEKVKNQSAESALRSFTEDTSRKTGVANRTVQQEVQIAQKITPKAKDLIRSTPTADNKTDLMKLAKAEPKQQVAAATLIANGKAKGVSEALTKSAPKDSIEEKNPGDPWKAFEDQVREVMSDLRSTSRKLGGVLEYNAETKQLRSQWARGYSHAGTIGAVNAIVRELEDGMPVEVNASAPGGYRVRRQVETRGGLARSA